MSEAPTPVAITSSTETTRHAREARHDPSEHLHAGVAVAAKRQDEEAGEAAEPHARGGEVRPVEHERQGRGRGLGGVPGEARDGQGRAACEQRPGEGEERRGRPLPAGAGVDPERGRGRRREQRQDQLEVCE